ncbi:MAG: YdbH domain-containing protein [Pseudomonadota bacterium]|nr:YdbH domain-containing protein [Pseudomonadota bacterium]
MKLLLKILLTILSFSLLLGGLWLSLPYLLAALAEKQFSQYGFSNVEVKISDVSLNSATVERLKMTNSSLDIDIKGLQARYHLSQLLHGQVIAIEAEKIILHRLPTTGIAAGLPDPVVLSGLLALPLQKYIPADTITVDALSFYEINGDLSMTGSIEVSKQGENTRAEMSLLDSKGKNHQLKLLDSPDSGIDMRWQVLDSEVENPVSLQIYPLKNGSGLAGTASINLSGISGLAAELNSLTGHVQAEFSYLRQVDNERKDIKLSAKINDAVFVTSRAKAVSLDVQAIVTENDNGFNVQFTPSSVVKIEGLQQENNSIEKVMIRPPLTLDFIEGRPQLNKGNGAELMLRNTALDNIRIPSMQIKDVFLTGGLEKESLGKCRFNLILVAPDVQIDDVNFQSSPIKVAGTCPDTESRQWSVTADSRTVSIENDDFQLPLSECRMTSEMAVKEAAASSLADIKGKLACRSDNQDSAISTSFLVNTDTGSGHADYIFDGIKPGDEKPLIGSLLKNWQQPFDIVSGTHSVKGRYRWWKNSTGRSREKLTMELKIDNAGGYHEEILFTGLNYKDQLELLPAIKSVAFSELTVRNIDIGMPITDVRAKVLLNVSDKGPLPLIKINGLNMSLLDGNVKGNGLEVDLNNSKHELVLVVVGLDLAQIVAMQQVEGLSATGRLDGYVPVTISENGIKITKGKIVAQQPGGKIQYKPAGGTAEMEKSAVGSEFVFRILEDLDYNSLNIDVDYSEDGEMELMLLVRGMSPKVDTKRPVHFNLNLQQNVLKLLQALRYADDLSEDIDKNLQKHFRNSKNPVN